MELRHLRYFIAVAEARNFGRAAQRLRMAQPPLSRQIQALEADVGVELFDRSHRQIELTEAGRVFLGEARRLLVEVERAIALAKRASRGEAGHIAVGYVSSAAFTGLAEVLRVFREGHLGVDIELRELAPSQQVKALRAREIDVGIVRAPIDDPALSAETIRREAFVAALPRTHPLAKKKTDLRLECLANEPFVLFSRWRGPAYFDQITSLCTRAGFSPRIEQESPMVDVLSLVAAGFGVSIVAESSRHVRRGDVVFRQIVGRPQTSLLLAWRKGDDSPVVRAFIQAVRKRGMRLRKSARVR